MTHDAERRNLDDAGDKLKEVARSLRADDLATRTEHILEGYGSGRFHLVVIGEFKRGKSSLVNALLGEDLLPTDVLPTTAVLHVIEHAADRQAEVVFQDGRREPWPATRESLSRLSAGGDVDSKSVRLARIGLPCPLLEGGTVLIDTPGVNDLTTQREEVTYTFLANADAAIFVLDATQPLSASEARFLDGQVLSQSVDRILFVLGKADRLSSDELQEALDGARRRLAEVLKRDPPAVLPFSTARKLEVAPGRMVEPVGELVAALAPLREAAEADRGRRCRARLAAVCGELTLGIDRATQLAREHAQLQEAESHVREGEQLRAEAKFERFLAAIDLAGRQTLARLVDESLSKLHKNLHEELDHQLTVITGNVHAFAANEIPHAVRRALRSWTETKGPEINAFLAKLTERVSTDYGAAFGGQVQMAGPAVSMELPDSADVPAGQTAGGQARELLETQLLPVAGGVMAGLWLISGPIGMIAGVLAGNYFGAKLREKRLDEQKTVVRQALPAMLAEVFGQFQEKTKGAIDQWFDRAKADLQALHDRTDAIAIHVAEAPPNEAALLEGRTIDDLRKELTELRQVIVGEGA